MKKLIFMLALFGLVFAAELGLAHDTMHSYQKVNGPGIKFETTSHDFGTMKEGDVVHCTFKFTNNGSAPLLIKEVEKPCGCTTPEWPQQPILPGQSGEIKVTYNSKERPGIFRKTLAVTTNVAPTTNEPLMLLIKGNVLTKKQWKQQNASVKK